MRDELRSLNGFLFRFRRKRRKTTKNEKTMKKNIAEILKYCPKGLALWSPAYGNVVLENVFITECTEGGIVVRTTYGSRMMNTEGMLSGDGECMLFPSKEQRDWDKFCPYEDGDVLRTFIVEIKYPECDKMPNAESYLQDLIEGDLVGDDVGRWCVNVKEVPYTVIEKEGKIWDPVKKELENIEIVAEEEKAEKFDINTLKPFDRVLVRDGDNYNWIAEIWTAYMTNYKYCKHRCLGGNYRQCIPYEGNEHLLLTEDMPDEYYITWEEEK